MQGVLIALGTAFMVAYAVIGGLMMTRWELEAASGVSFEETMARMRSADEAASAVPGFVFAALGVLLALAWALMASVRRAQFSGWFLLVAWGGLVALGAPAYFVASFGNMMSVGDTFYDWNSEAAFALVSPLYVASGLGAIVAVVAFMMGLPRSRPGPAPGLS